MRKHPLFVGLFLILIGFFPCKGEAETPLKSITYSFSLKSIAKNELIVTCTFQGDESGTTELVLPHRWANQSELHKNIENLSCLHHEIKDTDQSHIKQIFHDSGDKIVLSYHIKLFVEEACCQNYRCLLGGKAHFFALGHGMFVIPTQEDASMHIYLEWKDAPPTWEIANSFGINQVVQELVQTPAKLRSAAFMGGDFQIIECNKGASPVYVAMRGKWPFSCEEFVNIVEKVCGSQRNFWDDYEFPFYLVSVIPIKAKNYLSGTGLTNTFSLFLGDNEWAKAEYLKDLTWLVSHEHFHTWNGGKMRSSEREGSMYWFSEGFTEYYAVKLNHRYGIMAQGEYIDHINAILTNYYLSPVHRAPNARIVKEFWVNPDVKELPYNRGFTLALYLDAKIQTQGQGLSLDDFMRDVFTFTKQKNCRYSSEELLELLGKYLDQEEISAVKDMIFKGETVPLPQRAPVSGYTLIWENFLGFNLKSSLSTGVVEGVKRGSVPFQAGLINGSNLLKFEKKGTVVTLLVRHPDEDSPKTISYDLIEIKTRPQYVKENTK